MEAFTGHLGFFVFFYRQFFATILLHFRISFAREKYEKFRSNLFGEKMRNRKYENYAKKIMRIKMHKFREKNNMRKFREKNNARIELCIVDGLTESGKDR